MGEQAAFVYNDKLEHYRFSPSHPLNPLRLRLTRELLSDMGILEPGDLYDTPLAGEELLLAVHEPAYIEAVKRAGKMGSGGAGNGDAGSGGSDGVRGNNGLESIQSFGLGTEDDPVFPGMHDAARAIVGASVEAGRLVMEGAVNHALNIAGGMHHAHRATASGFCIYNDAAIAIAHLRATYGVRVAYIDTDAHHGDGVQWMFYEDDDVLTVSFHETGHYLFPGTGGPGELGAGKGFGFSVNIPLEPFTDDDSWLEVLELVLRPLVLEFQPDIIISQNGCDGHVLDPLTDLHASLRVYREIPRVVHQLAHEAAGGRWVALGGGGYDIWRVVPRAWAFLWGEMSGRPIPRLIPEKWRERWSEESLVELPYFMLDEPVAKVPRQAEIAEKNYQTAVGVLDKALAVMKGRHFTGY